MNANNISTLEEIRTSSTKPTHTENSACTQYIVNMVLVLGLKFDRNQIGLGDMAIKKKSYIYTLYPLLHTAFDKTLQTCKKKLILLEFIHTS